MAKKKLSQSAKFVVEDWKRRIGNRPEHFSLEIREAMVASCVMYLMVMRSEEFADRRMGDYVDLYKEVCDHLFPEAYEHA